MHKNIEEIEELIKKHTGQQGLAKQMELAAGAEEDYEIAALNRARYNGSKIVLRKVQTIINPLPESQDEFQSRLKAAINEIEKWKNNHAVSPDAESIAVYRSFGYCEIAIELIDELKFLQA